jgi:uncharacterized protein YndB with AHSA1/START domain
MNPQNNFPSLHLEYTFQASDTTVYDAWITKPVAELWLFKNKTNDLDFEADPKEGGRFSVAEKDGEKAIDHWGEYLQIERPHKLRFWKCPHILKA